MTTVAVAVLVDVPFPHVIEYSVLVVGDTTAVPVVEVDAVNAAEQLVAFVDDHVRVELWPEEISIGFATRVVVTIGVPPPPPVVTVTVAVLVAD